MGGLRSLNKGKRAERQVVKLLQPIIERVYREVLGDDEVDSGDIMPRLQRNTLQSDRGGYDIVGIEWMALEVKHHEQLAINTWWEQALRQTKSGQTTVLIFKQNRSKWRVMMNGLLVLDAGAMGSRVEIGLDDFLIYFERRVRWRLAVERLDAPEN